METKRNVIRTVINILAAAGLLAFITVSCLFLQGCGSAKAESAAGSVEASEDQTGEQLQDDTADGTQQNLAIVLGTHKYFPAFSLNTGSIYDLIYQSSYTYGKVSVIVSDGAPYLAAAFEISEPSTRVDKQKANQLANNNAAAIISEAPQAVAKTEEVDTLSAISLACDGLQSSGGETSKVLVICDSGMCTTGLLSMVNSEEYILDVSADEIVRQLEELHALPDLEGVSVIWIGLGAACGDQKSLSDSDQYLLEELWNAILTAGGAESVTFDTTPLSDEEHDGDLPFCTVIPVVTDSLDLSSAEVTESDLLGGIKWDGESKVNFLGDLAEFVDYDAAVEELMPIAQYLAENPDQSIYIFGMTASVSGGDSGIELAEARTEACKEILLQNGASEEQITCVGLGQTPNQYREDDLDSDGKQIEELAAKNRAVIIVSSESALVEELLNTLA